MRGAVVVGAAGEVVVGAAGEVVAGGAGEVVVGAAGEVADGVVDVAAWMVALFQVRHAGCTSEMTSTV